MALTADQLFEKIGSFGRFQLFILLMVNILEWFWFGWPVLLMTFIAAEPKWRCVSNQGNYINDSLSINSTGGINGSINSNSSMNSSNSILCPLDEAIGTFHKNYSLRCDIPRDSWEFVDDLTSVVTQVSPEIGAVKRGIDPGGGGGKGGVGCMEDQPKINISNNK